MALLAYCWCEGVHVLQGFTNFCQPLHSLLCAIQALAWVDHLQHATLSEQPMSKVDCSKHKVQQEQQQHLVQDLVFECATLQIFGDNVGRHGRLGSDFSICRSWLVMTIPNICHYVPV